MDKDLEVAFEKLEKERSTALSSMDDQVISGAVSLINSLCVIDATLDELNLFVVFIVQIEKMSSEILTRVIPESVKV